MSEFIKAFTFDRNAYRRNETESADLVISHIEKVARGEQLDKTASNIVGALASYMGLFRKINGKLELSKVAVSFVDLSKRNRADAWRWLITRSLHKFVVPNGTACKVNAPAETMKVKFAFFHLIVQLLTLLSALPDNGRFLYFEELCKLLADDAHWQHSGAELMSLVLKSRLDGTGGFGSERSLLEDLENSLTKSSEFDIPRDNFSGLFLKAFYQTGLFELLTGADGKHIAIAIRPNLEEVLQRRIRFVLDHPPVWHGEDWLAYLDIQAEDLPQEVTPVESNSPPEATEMASELQDLVPAALEQLKSSSLQVTREQLLRFAACLTSKRFLIVTGLAGSGKTKLSQAFAKWITPREIAADPFAIGSSFPSTQITYHVTNSDAISVEFANKEGEDATKVLLPRAMIREWADYVDQNDLPESTPARQIREGVKASSKFSDQLHSFESQLKTAAFGLLRSVKSTGGRKCYELVPVGADWTGSDNIVGYPNGLDDRSYISKPALDLILHAERNPHVPHFLILDEMNLSHVERYFADILSTIESEDCLRLYPGDLNQRTNWRKGEAGSIPPSLTFLPQNLFIIGTVNVDETTYMFSPKVLDRANVIEFRMDASEMERFLATTAKPDLSKLDGMGATFGKPFVDAAKASAVVPPEVRAEYETELILFFRALQPHGVEFGYRTAHESSRFMHQYKVFGGQLESDQWFSRAFDCVIFQKVLPKLHGSRAKLGPILKKLWFLCTADVSARAGDAISSAEAAARSTKKEAEPSPEIPKGAPYPLSAEKIARMWRLLNDNGFASFSEA